MRDSIVKDLITKEDQPLDEKLRADLRAKIHALESLLIREEQVEIKTTHHFSKDVYAREIKAPKGTLLIGKIHKHENLNILSQGEITVISIDGIKRMKAPCTIVSSPGVKRLAYVHEDIVWTTIHGTNETDLEKIENEFIAKTYDDVVELPQKGVKNVLGDCWSSGGDCPALCDASAG